MTRSCHFRDLGENSGVVLGSMESSTSTSSICFFKCCVRPACRVAWFELAFQSLCFGISVLNVLTLRDNESLRGGVSGTLVGDWGHCPQEGLKVFPWNTGSLESGLFKKELASSLPWGFLSSLTQSLSLLLCPPRGPHQR